MLITGRGKQLQEALGRSTQEPQEDTHSWPLDRCRAGAGLQWTGHPGSPLKRPLQGLRDPMSRRLSSLVHHLHHAV